MGVFKLAVSDFKMGLKLNMQLEKIDRVLQTMMMAPRSNLGVSSQDIFTRFRDQFLLELTGINNPMSGSDVYICYDQLSASCSLCLHQGDESLLKEDENYKLYRCLSDTNKFTAFANVCKTQLAPTQGIKCSVVAGPQNVEITITDERFVGGSAETQTLLFDLTERS